MIEADSEEDDQNLAATVMGEDEAVTVVTDQCSSIRLLVPHVRRCVRCHSNHQATSRCTAVTVSRSRTADVTSRVATVVSVHLLPVTQVVHLQFETNIQTTVNRVEMKI